MKDGKVPDFALIHSILSLVTECGIELDLPELLSERNCFRSQCQHGLELLVSRKEFDSALQLASLADLPSDSVFVTQLKAQFENDCLPADASDDPVKLLGIRTAFWNHCHQLLTKHRVLPDIACQFYQV